MRKILSFVFVICMALLLTVPAVADVAPVPYFQVTVGDKPITRYRIEYEDDDPVALAEDGVFRAGEQIELTDVIAVNGTKYGSYTTWNQEDEPVTNEYGIRINQWKTSYFLLEDALSPSELKEVDTTFKQVRELSLPIVTQTNPMPTATETQTSVTAPPTTQPPTTASTTATTTATTTTTTATTTTTTATTADETRTEAKTQLTETQSQATEPEDASDDYDERVETDLDAFDETDVVYTYEEPDHAPHRGSSALQNVLICIGCAAVLALTAAVTLLLIRRKKQNKQTRPDEPEE